MAQPHHGHEQVFDHPRFIGLWTYRPHGGARQFCASVMVDGVVQETDMHDGWSAALRQAGEILDSAQRVRGGVGT